MEERVKKIMSQVFGIEISEINERSSKDNIENWDSMNQMNLVTALEEEFQIIFKDEQILEMLNFKLICALLKECGVK